MTAATRAVQSVWKAQHDAFLPTFTCEKDETWRDFLYTNSSQKEEHKLASLFPSQWFEWYNLKEMYLDSIEVTSQCAGRPKPLTNTARREAGAGETSVQIRWQFAFHSLPRRLQPVLGCQSTLGVRLVVCPLPHPSLLPHPVTTAGASDEPSAACKHNVDAGFSLRLCACAMTASSLWAPPTRAPDNGQINEPSAPSLWGWRWRMKQSNRSDEQVEWGRKIPRFSSCQIVCAAHGYSKTWTRRREKQEGKHK